MIKKCLLLSLLVLSACSSIAQPVVASWPAFSCTSNDVVLTFVDLQLCTKAGAYSKVQVLAGTTPSIAFEQKDSRFDVLSYEAAELALARLPARLESASAAQALATLFSWQGKTQLSAKQQALLQVFDINPNTKLRVFKNGDFTAYLRLNAEVADNTIFITAANSEKVYRLIGNFSEAEAKQWLSQLAPVVKP